MDPELEKYRFGVTLDLSPGVYQFAPDIPNPVWVSTICKAFRQYLIDQNITLLYAGYNSYFCLNVGSCEIIKTHLKNFWISVGGICPEE